MNLRAPNIFVIIQNGSVRCPAAGLTPCARMTVWPIRALGSPPPLPT
jgi:hypothetical protein